MVTALQIGLLLVLIALIGIILGYLFGKLSCRKQSENLYFDKNDYCENNSLASIDKVENFQDEGPSVLSSTNIATVEKSSIDNFADSKMHSKTEVDSIVNNEPQGLINQNNNYSLSDERKNTQNGSINSSESISQEGNIVEYSSEGQKPNLLSEARDNKPDNLCRIKGIGFVIEEKLHNLGVFHFDQIAAWTEEEILWVDSHLAFSGRIKREDWIGQAKKLASGEETEFSKRVDKGDVSTSRKSTNKEKKA